MEETKDLITTYSGVKFDPINPKPDMIQINDIAHALSMMCRANGHCLFFYSVGQHSINCAIEAKARNLSKKVQLACLLHDGSEAYMADVVRPYKKHLDEYLVFEDRLQTAIWQKFCEGGLSEEETKQVFRVDDIILYNEFEKTMRKNVLEKDEPCVGDIILHPVEMNYIEDLFLKMFNEIMN
ncbi:MAG: phosphohydrolase [Clostridia bacterium]